MSKTTLVTFDVYMALLDIQGGLADAFAQAASISNSEASGMVALWRAKQMERAASSNALAGSHTSFRDCTTMALSYVSKRHNLHIPADAVELLIDAWAYLKPWPEADAALQAIRAKGYQIAILSNGDQAMLERVAAQFSTPFDHVFSAESAGFYKPHPSVYDLPKLKANIATDATVHVAGSGNDVLGAVAYGMQCIWSNRVGDVLVDERFPPTHEVSQLGAIAQLL